MSKIVKIDLEGTSIFDRECARFIHELILRNTYDMEPMTIKNLAQQLEIRPDRASRIIRRLGIRKRFDGI